MSPRLVACAVVASACLAPPVALADDQVALPAPLRVTDVVRVAKLRRPEVLAARARACRGGATGDRVRA